MDIDSLRGAVQGSIFKQKVQEATDMAKLRRLQIQEYVDAANERQAVGKDFAGLVRELPGARQMGPLDPRLAPYYEATADEMPERPVRPMSEYVPELAGRFPLAPQHLQYDNFMRPLQTSGASEMPRPYRSPEGNPFLIYRNTMLPDRAGGAAEKETAGDYPWLLTDDLEEFKRELRGVRNVKQRDLIIDARRRFENATSGARPNPFKEFMDLLGGGAPAESGGKTPPAGGQYEYDPKTRKLVPIK
jgi:hypothetical protein